MVSSCQTASSSGPLLRRVVVGIGGEGLAGWRGGAFQRQRGSVRRRGERAGARRGLGWADILGRQRDELNGFGRENRGQVAGGFRWRRGERLGCGRRRGEPAWLSRRRQRTWGQGGG